MEKLATFVRVNKANGVAASAKSKKKVLEIGEIQGRCRGDVGEI